MKELGVLIGPGIRIDLVNDMLIFRRPYRYSDVEGLDSKSNVKIYWKLD
jgi:hypothetical protein